VGAYGIHALASDGHKWLTGPEGCGILYINPELMEQVEPVEFGWTNVASYNDYGSRDMTLRADAGRYEPGTLNTIGCFGLKAAIEFILEVGPAEIGPAVQSLADRVATGAQAKGYEIMVKRTPENGAGIVALRKPSVESLAVVNKLSQAKIATAARAGWVRVSPHFYIQPDDIDQMLEVLP
jgi:selenocysteine lyase/cysteine desulfurase